MALEGRTQKIIRQMQNEGRIFSIPKEVIERIQHKVALAYAPKIEEFRKKEKASRIYIADIESGRINFYKPDNFYQKVKDYFSNIFK
ncbi:hypothetical protein KAI04_01175 [Candidatus Pacearchaeota archaeon]|nr:hypothetical protein [Candidatus Pacearchaeota archaeon]